VASQSAGGGDSSWVDDRCGDSSSGGGVSTCGSSCAGVCNGSSTAPGLAPSWGNTGLSGLSEGFVVSEHGVVWAMNSDSAKGAGLCGVGRLRGDALLDKSMAELVERAGESMAP